MSDEKIPDSLRIWYGLVGGALKVAGHSLHGVTGGMIGLGLSTAGSAFLDAARTGEDNGITEGVIDPYPSDYDPHEQRRKDEEARRNR